MTFRIVPIADEYRQRAAELLVECFREHWPEAWPTLDSAVDEVAEVCDLGPALGALDEDGMLLGWIGARPNYRGYVWEIHPLAVDERFRRRGIARGLIAEIERLAADAGAETLMVGSDDEDGMTSLAGVDLYPDPARRLTEIEDRKGHPFAFYLRCGFSLVGVVPDANGFGRPDILLAKRVARR